jgi:hypothetical protein
LDLLKKDGGMYIRRPYTGCTKELALFKERCLIAAAGLCLPSTMIKQYLDFGGTLLNSQCGELTKVELGMCEEEYMFYAMGLLVEVMDSTNILGLQLIGTQHWA